MSVARKMADQAKILVLLLVIVVELCVYVIAQANKAKQAKPTPGTPTAAQIQDETVTQ